MMEERRTGQKPDAEERPAAQGVYEQAAPKSQPVSAKEKAQIADAQKRAQRDRDEALATGHGDHKGEEGN
ncbi:hypothetical protein K3M67_20270 (plasmid) [Sphingobium sp. V4]|uniref:hypothetical protein n=1 Tax=Sphingobium sp. V4 TaxID=3038927 RepID=UPI002557D07E|nr:hypothetical protein [Sphingobium sp. V4]WIW90367.1 hypothetical protein K3M67_20270 [Sphingobium sp. V4]